jgi:hypothetical protein
MKADYEDILERIDMAPFWYDENGTPRYAPFHPSMSPNIYARQVTLLRIQCQACHLRFMVEMNTGIWGGETLPRNLHYGDPPRHGCIGDTMNCEDLAVLEAWNKAGLGEWERHPEHEGLIDEAHAG